MFSQSPKDALLKELANIDKQMEELRRLYKKLRNNAGNDSAFNKGVDETEKASIDSLIAVKNIEAGIPPYKEVILDAINKPLNLVKSDDIQILRALVGTLETMPFQQSKNDHVIALGKVVHFINGSDPTNKEVMQNLAGDKSLNDLCQDALNHPIEKKKSSSDLLKRTNTPRESNKTISTKEAIKALSPSLFRYVDAQSKATKQLKNSGNR